MIKRRIIFFEKESEGKKKEKRKKLQAQLNNKAVTLFLWVKSCHFTF